MCVFGKSAATFGCCLRALGWARGSGNKASTAASYAGRDESWYPWQSTQGEPPGARCPEEIEWRRPDPNMKMLPACARFLKFSPALAGTVLTLLPALHADAFDVRVTIESLAPNGGTLLTPVWVGFHDGTFDLYDRGAPASAALERLAEDGTTGPLSAAFAASGAGIVDATIVSGLFPPFAPGARTSKDFSLDASSPQNRYFSYASMVIPSNDAFIANGNPLAVPVFDGTGAFIGADFILVGSMILDAGTEVNDELPMNTAFLGQASPDTGLIEGGIVELHPGFRLAGSGGILDGSFAGFSFENADFLAPGYQVVRITVTPVPEGSTVLSGGILVGALGAGLFMRFRRNAA